MNHLSVQQLVQVNVGFVRTDILDSNHIDTGLIPNAEYQAIAVQIDASESVN